MPDQAQGPQQAQQGMQEGPQAPPQGQQSSFGMAEAGAGGAPMPSSGHDGGQQQSDSTEQKDSNPYRWAQAFVGEQKLSQHMSHCSLSKISLPVPKMP